MISLDMPGLHCDLHQIDAEVFADLNRVQLSGIESFGNSPQCANEGAPRRFALCRSKTSSELAPRSQMS